MDCSAALKKITSSWFFNEPLLFSIACSHQLVPNESLTVPMRTGQKRIEYSPVILNACTTEQLEAYLKIEVYRILLLHPYARQPLTPNRGILLIASDAAIYSLTSKDKSFDCVELPGIMYLKNQAVKFQILTHPLGLKWAGSEELKFFQRNLQIDHNTGKLVFTDDLSFEQWYKKILFLVKETAIAGENAGVSEGENAALETAAELWEENQEVQDEIKENIKRAEIEQGWGSLGGGLSLQLKKSEDFSFDYRRALTQFRQSIVSPNRSLTRMRPSRRYGFKAMGSRYERKANILIAVDVSGSITEESFEHFYRAINNFFFLGLIEKIDLIFFDVNLKNSKPVSFHKKIELESIKGRGGTNFQPAIDFYIEHNFEYSGLIIFTDGEGNPPVINTSKTNILWILEGRLAWEKSKRWINTLPGCKSTYLPF